MQKLYFSGGDVSSSSSFDVSSSGGLVGGTGNVTITNSYFSGGNISSSGSPSSSSHSGGLVGSGDGTITNSYFSGGGISSSGAPSGSAAASFSGGLVGEGNTVSITNSYWNTNAPQSVNSATQTTQLAQGDDAASTSGGLTPMQLKATGGTYPDGLSTQAWDLTAGKLPAIKLCIPTITGTGAIATTNWATCASYGDLLAGQR